MRTRMVKESFQRRKGISTSALRVCWHLSRSVLVGVRYSVIQMFAQWWHFTSNFTLRRSLGTVGRVAPKQKPSALGDWRWIWISRLSLCTKLHSPCSFALSTGAVDRRSVWCDDWIVNTISRDRRYLWRTATVSFLIYRVSAFLFRYFLLAWQFCFVADEKCVNWLLIIAV